MAVSRVRNEYSLYIRNFNVKQVLANDEYLKEIEDLKTNRKYECINSYLEDQIFVDDKNEVKFGYLNINALKNKVEDVDEDKNLLNLDCLVLSETKLSKCDKLNFKNWNLVRYDFEDNTAKSPHLGMAFLLNKTSTHSIQHRKSSSFKLSGNANFQYFEVNLNKVGLKGIFYYVNKKPNKKDVVTIIKHFKSNQVDFFIGDLNLNYINADDRKRISELTLGLNLHSILYQRTRMKSHLDHVMIAKTLKLQAYSTSFVNLYTDHSAVTLRICKDGKFTTEFVEDQIRKQELNYLKQKDPVLKEEKGKNPKIFEERETGIGVRIIAEEEIVMKGRNFVLSESELDRLNPPQYLSDEIINAYMHLISERYKNVFTFDTFFHKTLEENGFNKNRSYVNLNPFQSKKWIMPVNIQNCHWILLYFSLEHLHQGQVAIDLFDSANELNYFYDIKIDELQKYINFLHEKHEKSRIGNLHLVLKNVSNKIPQQENGYDCGAYLLCFALCLAEQKEMHFRQNDVSGFRQNLKHEFRRKSLDKERCLFYDDQNVKMNKGGKRAAGNSFKNDKKRKKKDENLQPYLISAGEHAPTKFFNDGELCWLNSLLHLLLMIYTQDKGSVMLKLLFEYKEMTGIADAQRFRHLLTICDQTLRYADYKEIKV